MIGYSFDTMVTDDRRILETLARKISRLHRILIRAKAARMTLDQARREVERCHLRIAVLQKRIKILEARPRRGDA